jgi:hypothetical protein
MRLWAPPRLPPLRLPPPRLPPLRLPPLRLPPLLTSSLNQYFSVVVNGKHHEVIPLAQIAQQFGGIKETDEHLST